MSCCGKKREEILQRRTISVPPAPPLPAPPLPAPAQPRTPVVFKGAGSYLVTGEHSRDVYHFSQEQPEQWIDPEDVQGLLSTGFFQARS
jgi:hypothetical protein